MNLPNRSKLKSFKAFTLIELLIVIGIIGILAGIVLVIINPVEQQKKANDAVILASMEKLTASLEAYYSANFSYPANCAALAADTTSRVSCYGTSTVLFSIDGVNLPADCATYGYDSGTSPCYFYYWTSQPGCIFVRNHRSTSASTPYYVSRYGRVKVASNYHSTGCYTIAR